MYAQIVFAIDVNYIWYIRDINQSRKKGSISKWQALKNRKVLSAQLANFSGIVWIASHDKWNYDKCDSEHSKQLVQREMRFHSTDSDLVDKTSDANQLDASKINIDASGMKSLSW